MISKTGKEKVNKKEVVHKLRATIWFDYIRSQLKLPRSASPYKVGKTIGQLLNGEDENVEIGNRWSTYAKGTKPSASFVEAVDGVIPKSDRFQSSARLLNHPLWEVLRSDYKNSLNDEVLLRLAFVIQSIVFSRTSVDVPRKKITKKLLTGIVKHASLDALACLVILLREVTSKEGADIAVDIGICIHDVLLMLYAIDDFAPTQFDLLDLFEDRVFSLIRDKNKGTRIHVSFFVLVSQLQSRLTAHSLRIGRSLTRKEKLESLYEHIGRNMVSIRFNPTYISLHTFDLSNPLESFSQRYEKHCEK